MTDTKVIRAYKDEYYPPVATAATKRMRTNIPIQLFKFLKLNYKIMRIVVKGHS